MFNWDYEVHAEPIYKRYYVSPFSSGFLLSLVVGFVLMMMSIFISYNTWGTPYSNVGFWFKEEVLYEQPVVDYRHQGIVEMHGRSVDGGAFNIYYSTSQGMNQQHGDTLRMGMIQSASIDENHDGVPDQLQIVITMPLRQGEEVLGLQALVTHDVRLREKAKVVFDSASYFQYEAGDAAMSSLSMGGDLIVAQAEPLVNGRKYQTPYNGNPLLDRVFTAGSDASLTSIQHIVNAAAARTLTTKYEVSYASAVRASRQDFGVNANIFNATITVRIPSQPVRVSPAIAEVLKVAWIQFLVVFFPLGALLHYFMTFVFSQKLVAANMIADVVVEKND